MKKFEEKSAAYIQIEKARDAKQLLLDEEKSKMENLEKEMIELNQILLSLKENLQEKEREITQTHLQLEEQRNCFQKIQSAMNGLKSIVDRSNQ